MKANSDTSTESISGISNVSINRANRQLDQRLWRAIDFLHLFVMLFSLYTAVILAVLRKALIDQCPLYGRLFLRPNSTNFSSEIIGRNTSWGSVYTCEFASFAYLSAFTLSFISLWIHIVFRRVLFTERLLRFPIGLATLTFAIISFIATIFITDGLIKFCSNSERSLCSSAGSPAFQTILWQLISVPVGGWLTTVALFLNALTRGIQLFSKPKKSPETLKILLSQMLNSRHQERFERDSATQPSRSSVEKGDSQIFSNNPRSFYYPPIPQYRQIKKPSTFRRLCCPCLGRRRHRSTGDPYRPFILSEEYRSRLNSSQTAICSRHSLPNLPQPVERAAQTETTDETPFEGRRRSSVRFEDEITSQSKSEETKTNELQRNVSFRNNEDDLWTTVTINGEHSSPVQSSHFNRLALENLSSIDTSMTRHDNGVTAIHVNSKSMDITSINEPSNEIFLSSPPPFSSSSMSTRQRSIVEDDPDLQRIKPVEEIRPIVTDKYNYDDLSQALKSNVQRLKQTFLQREESTSHYDRPKNILLNRLQPSANHQQCSTDC